MTMWKQPGNNPQSDKLLCFLRAFQNAARLRVWPAILAVVIIIGLSPDHAQSKGPPQTFPGNAKGQAAIDRLGDRLPDVAKRHGWTSRQLKAVFLRDHDLSLDPSDRLLYQCGMGLPEGVAAPDTIAEADAPVSMETYPLEQTFMLHSRPGASKVIYLDFDGHYTTDSAWTRYNNGLPVDSQPFDLDGNSSTFSDTERLLIQKIWLRVVEDFSMLDVDVTTEDPGVEALRKASSGDEYYGIRSVISPTKVASFSTSGGVAYVGSFDDYVDLPAFSFSSVLRNNEKYIAESIAHEVGHTLGLSHDGTTSGTEYYAGHGNWAPIMGNSYYKTVTQWSKGEYAGANNTQDDLATMLNYGPRYTEDYHGETLTGASFLSGTTISDSGIIYHRDDMDIFSFSTGAGNISLSVTPAPRDADLDIALQLFDGNGEQVAVVDQTANLEESLSLNVAAGMYYLVVDGVGTGDPSTGYSDYASLGQYILTGALQQTTTSNPPSFTSATLVGDEATEGSAYIISIAHEAYDPDGDEVYFSINGPAWLTAADNGTLSGTPESVDVGTNTWTVEVTDTSGNSDTAQLEIYVNEMQTPVDPPVTEVTPLAPRILSATPLSSTSIKVVWDDLSNNEVGFTVERSAGGTNWVVAGSVGADVQAFTDNGLSPLTVYSYRIKAYNNAGDSTYSGEVSAQTGPEEYLTVDMAGSSAEKNKKFWDAIVIITASSGSFAVEGVTVGGTWSGGVTGTASCITDLNGQCTIIERNLQTNVTALTFTLDNVLAEGFIYDSVQKSITVYMP